MTLSTLFALLTLDMDDDELSVTPDPDALKDSDAWLSIMAERLEPVTSLSLTA